MASGSDIGKTLPYAGKWTTTTLSSYDEDVVPEPSLRLDLQKVWESQVIFPYSVDNLVHAFGGPKPSDKSRNSKVLSIFPVYKPCAPRVFISEPYNFSYIKAPNRVFRSAPSLNDQYLGWLDRIQRDKADIWQACGNYDLIQLSRTGLKYQQEMIIAALHFFESSTNTFHFECGMMTPTLLDVAAITGLSPLGDTYDPFKASDTIKFDFRNKSYSKYIVENRKTNDEVTIQLCSTCSCEHLKRTGDGSTFLGAGPFWLLQLWLTATFHTELDLFLPEPYYEESRTRQIEGTRLARMVPRERGLSYDVAFQQYFNAFLSLKKFKPSFAPFVDRPLGPPWFTQAFPSPPEFEVVTNSIWSAYLMPTVLSCRIGLTSGDFGLVGYFPNLVSRQFGLTQILPKSIYLEEREVCLGKHGMTEPQFHSFLNHFNQPSYELTPFDFAPSHACTREFFNWWSRHYEGRLVNRTALLTAISDGFDSSILNKIKSKLNARGSKSKTGSSNSNKPLPPPPKVELKITSRKRSHSAEAPSASKKQRPIPATCSSAPDKVSI
ncbi:uncharacterized protein LOC123922982 [Trifolium pratense]|uniref:uncharacterized protein LOC123922982 n=1 Tax=Trifolium pratense TaxID=57577 RepID=UPI001E6978B1|nr:uncharacterized protein LOC123922982 [Trifolium pratense]